MRRKTEAVFIWRRVSDTGLIWTRLSEAGLIVGFGLHGGGIVLEREITLPLLGSS